MLVDDMLVESLVYFPEPMDYVSTRLKYSSDWVIM